MTEETAAKPAKSKPEPIMDPAMVGALSSQLFAKLLDAAERGRLNYGTLASLLGTSRSRLTQLSDSVSKGEGINVSTHIFLSIVRCTKRIEQLLESGVLPATASKGKSQEEARLQLLQP